MPSLDFHTSAAPTWVVLLAATLLGAVAWYHYRRETRSLGGAAVRWLPAIRFLIVFLVVVLFAAPILLRRTVRTPRRGRVLVVIDRSLSMARTDAGMAPERRTALLEALGLTSPNEPSATGEATRWLDAASRWQRVERCLLDSDNGVLRELAWPHRVEIAYSGKGLEPGPALAIEGPEEVGGNLPKRLLATPDVPFTDLARSLGDIEKGPPPDLRAVVLFSDGRHNARVDRDGALQGSGETPAAVARRLGSRGIRIFPVGVGSSREPLDIGIVELRVPDRVSVEEPLEGTLVLKVRTTPRERFRISLNLEGAEAGGREIWAADLAGPDGEDVEIVELPFRIPPETLSEGRSEITARLTPLSGELTHANNRRTFLVTASRRDLRVLIVAGRPRWEMRYLKNLFQRDERTSVNTVSLGVKPGETELPRGGGAGQFPPSEEELNRYGLIVIGDLSATAFRPEELSWIRRFVDYAGGGLVFIAGRRNHLAEYLETPLGPLVPVDFADRPTPWPPGAPLRIRLGPDGLAVRALRLLDDEELNASLWQILRPLSWVQLASARAGSEVWVETQLGKVPVMVERVVGRGRVLYVGTDETWRWRFKVGDRYHQRFWGQILEHFREELFALETRRVSLDSDAASYGEGQAVALRLRLRDEEGRPWTAAAPSVQALRSGELVSELPLTAESRDPALYTGSLSGLPAGNYRLVPRVPGLEAGPHEAGLPIIVRGRESSREQLYTSWDEDLLRRLALESGGEYLREEDFRRLPDLLADVSGFHEEEHAVDLSRSWPCFAVLLALLTLEWVLRKRLGLL